MFDAALINESKAGILILHREQLSRFNLTRTFNDGEGCVKKRVQYRKKSPPTFNSFKDDDIKQSINSDKSVEL